MAGQDQQFKLVEAFISSDRFAEKEIEVSSNVYEIVIYEDIESAWLTGKVVITDDTGFLTKLDFKGSESITFRIAGAEENSDPIIDKTFLMYSLKKSVRANDNATTYMFNIIEPHAFVNALKPFSRAYTGSIEKIITQIVNSELKKTVDLSYLTNGVTAQGERKYLVPYLTPIEACEVLIDRGTTEFGSPLFLYASIHDNNIRLGDLDRMLSQEAFNSKVPYLYSQASTQSTSSINPALASTSVLALDFGSPVDTLTQIEEGVFGSFYTSTDVSTGVSYRTRITLKNIFSDMQANEIIDPKSKQDLYDDQHKIEERTLDDFDSIYWHQINASNLFPDYKGYHDDNSNASFGLKVKSNILRQTLLSNTISMVVPGIAFLMAKATVGDIVSLNVLSPEQKNDKIYDERWSGNYVISKTKHVFRETTHNITCEISKINRPSNRVNA